MKSEKQSNFMMELIFNLAIPTFILMKLSGESALGPLYGLVVALLFPFVYGFIEVLTKRKVNLFSALGIISVLLTGGIGLLQLDPQYIAIKEALIPFLIGVVTLASQYTRFPIVRRLLISPKVWNIQQLEESMFQQGHKVPFQEMITRLSWGVSGAFFLSSALNYILARLIVQSPAGTEAFNQELGKMTALSFPVIVLPTMLVLIGCFLYLFKRIKQLSGQPAETFLKQ